MLSNTVQLPGGGNIEAITFQAAHKFHPSSKASLPHTPLTRLGMAGNCFAWVVFSLITFGQYGFLPRWRSITRDYAG
jgi:hypothetical protein